MFASLFVVNNGRWIVLPDLTVATALICGGHFAGFVDEFGGYIG